MSEIILNEVFGTHSFAVERIDVKRVLERSPTRPALIRGVTIGGNASAHHRFYERQAMANKMPRVPEANRSPKGRTPVVKQDTRKKTEPENPKNPDQQGETGNIRQNTQSRQKNR